jgi:hypothetical protein
LRMMRLGFHCGFVLNMVLNEPKLKNTLLVVRFVIFLSLAELYFKSTIVIYA